MLKYIEDLAQGMDSKFIVFFRHRLVCQAIVQKLVTLKLKHICIAGDVPSGMRGVWYSSSNFLISLTCLFGLSATLLYCHIHPVCSVMNNEITAVGSWKEYVNCQHTAYCMHLIRKLFLNPVEFAAKT